jgi:hypothetical protein
MIAKWSLEAVEFVKRNTRATIEFYSNASGRTSDWWRELGKILSTRVGGKDRHYRQNDLGIFSIDGLEDTNALYRRHTNFEKIMENATAFIGAGGIARWDFIVFEHNQHQVEEARARAQQMGFKEFRLRKTARFNHSPLGPEEWPVYSVRGDLEYVLRPPTHPDYRNDELDKFEQLIQAHGSADAYFEVATISCLYRQRFKRIYVNSSAKVFPCSFLANDSVATNVEVPTQVRNGRVAFIRYDSQQKVYRRTGFEFNDLRRHSWNEILHHPWFKSELEASWAATLATGKLKRCARTCGDAYSPILSQSHDEQLARLRGRERN